MANAAGRTIKPSVARDDNGTFPTADGKEANSNQTNKLLDLRDELGTESAETDSALTEQSGLHEDQLLRGVTQKRCQWFSDTQVDVDLNASSSFSPNKRSAAHSPKIRKRVQLQRKKSSCRVHSVIDKNPGPDYSLGHSESESSTEVCTTRSTVISLCFPPGCIPSGVIAQISATSKERSFVPLDKGWEVDLWMDNICAEASTTLTNQAQPEMISAPVVHDLKEDAELENNLLPNAVLEMFLKNHRVVYRRNAICEELERIMSLVKINGRKFSLWHLRAELQIIKDCR